MVDLFKLDVDLLRQKKTLPAKPGARPCTQCASPLAVYVASSQANRYPNMPYIRCTNGCKESWRLANESTGYQLVDRNGLAWKPPQAPSLSSTQRSGPSQVVVHKCRGIDCSSGGVGNGTCSYGLCKACCSRYDGPCALTAHNKSKSKAIRDPPQVQISSILVDGTNDDDVRAANIYARHAAKAGRHKHEPSRLSASPERPGNHLSQLPSQNRNDRSHSQQAPPYQASQGGSESLRRSQPSQRSQRRDLDEDRDLERPRPTGQYIARNWGTALRDQVLQRGNSKLLERESAEKEAKVRRKAREEIQVTFWSKELEEPDISFYCPVQDGLVVLDDVPGLMEACGKDGKLVLRVYEKGVRRWVIRKGDDPWKLTSSVRKILAYPVGMDQARCLDLETALTELDGKRPASIALSPRSSDHRGSTSGPKSLSRPASPASQTVSRPSRRASPAGSCGASPLRHAWW